MTIPSAARAALFLYYMRGGLTLLRKGRKHLELHLHDKVELKKAHPCGSRQWEILRVGMDIKLKCLGCGHELMLPRSKAEKSIKKILIEEDRHE